MPQLKQLSCCVVWSNTDASFKEYGTVYGDGVVETFIVVPHNPQGFYLRLTSHGFIYSGLAMVVFIDGNYQCNRTRVNLLAPKKGHPSNRTEVDFVLRQKEKAHGDGVYMGRQWRFDDHNIGKFSQIREAPKGCQESHFDDLGTIEVLVLRCQAANVEDAEYEGSSSGEDSDIFAERLSGEEVDTDKPESIHKSRRIAAAATQTSGSKLISEEDESGGFFSIFDGANDRYHFHSSHKPRDNHVAGQWVWHQKHSPYGLHMDQPRCNSLGQEYRSQLPYYDYPTNPSPRHQQDRSQSIPGSGPKRVHFDYGANEQYQQQSQQQSPHFHPHNHPLSRPQSRERFRESDTRQSNDPRRDFGPPYESQQIRRNAKDNDWPKMREEQLGSSQSHRHQPERTISNPHQYYHVPPPPIPQHYPFPHPSVYGHTHLAHIPGYTLPNWAPYYPYTHSYPLPAGIVGAPYVERPDLCVPEEDVSPKNTTLSESCLQSELKLASHDYGNNTGNNGGWDGQNANNANSNDHRIANSNNASGGADWTSNGQDQFDTVNKWDNSKDEDSGGKDSNQTWNNENVNNNENSAGWADANGVGQNSSDNNWQDNVNTVENNNGDSWENNNNGPDNSWDVPVSGDKQHTNSSSETLASSVRQLYGPHGPYYSFRPFQTNEPRPDAEEEPRFDVPKALATSRRSTKQVQPGPGYRYFKKRMVPEYVDSLEDPYARFVFKYRTRDQLPGEVGIEVEDEPTGNQEIQDLQSLEKQSLIEMLIRAKSALGGKVPSPLLTSSTPTNGSDSSLPVAVDAPIYSYLKYSLPPLRPGNVNKNEHFLKSSSENVSQKHADSGLSNNQKSDDWSTPAHQENNQSSANTNEGQGGWSNGGQINSGKDKGGIWDLPSEIPPRPSTPLEYRQQNDNSNNSWDNTNQAQGATGYEPKSGW